MAARSSSTSSINPSNDRPRVGLYEQRLRVAEPVLIEAPFPELVVGVRRSPGDAARRHDPAHHPDRQPRPRRHRAAGAGHGGPGGLDDTQLRPGKLDPRDLHRRQHPGASRPSSTTGTIFGDTNLNPQNNIVTITGAPVTLPISPKDLLHRRGRRPEPHDQAAPGIAAARAPARRLSSAGRPADQGPSAGGLVVYAGRRGQRPSRSRIRPTSRPAATTTTTAPDGRQAVVRAQRPRPRAAASTALDRSDGPRRSAAGSRAPAGEAATPAVEPRGVRLP